MNLQHLLPHHLEVAVGDRWPLLVPLGSVEYHGPHLPLGVDSIVAEELCQRVAGRVNADVAFEKTLAERGSAWWGRAPLRQDDNIFDRIQVWPSVLPEAAAAGVQMADHAGFYETSLMLAARPDLADMTRLGPHAPWYTNAVTSKAQLASCEAGERMWTAMVDAWVKKLSALSRSPVTSA